MYKGFDAGRDAPSQAPIWMGGRHLELAKRPSQGRCRACAPALPLTVPRPRTTVAEPIGETLAELPFTGDQAVCLGHDKAAWSGPALYRGQAGRISVEAIYLIGSSDAGGRSHDLSCCSPRRMPGNGTSVARPPKAAGGACTVVIAILVSALLPAPTRLGAQVLRNPETPYHFLRYDDTPEDQQNPSWRNDFWAPIKFIPLDIAPGGASSPYSPIFTPIRPPTACRAPAYAPWSIAKARNGVPRPRSRAGGVAALAQQSGLLPHDREDRPRLPPVALYHTFELGAPIRRHAQTIDDEVFDPVHVVVPGQAPIDSDRPGC